MPDSETYLGFDFGTKRIGIAVGQTVTLSATALKGLTAHGGVPNWDEVLALVARWRPTALVVGIPLNMDGSEQNTTQMARLFADQLAEHTGLPVHHTDERLTTVVARSEVFERGGYKALQRQSIDSVAAKLLLESWMRSR